MRKKLLLLSAIATFALALCGCDSDKNDSNSEPTTTTEATIEETTEATTEATTEEATEAEDISEQVDDAVRGEVVDGVFTNEVFKISFPIDDSWYVCTDEEIAQILGLTADSLDDSGDITAEQFEAATSGTIYDIVFYLSDYQSNVNVTYVNLSGMGLYAAAPATTYAEASIESLETMTSVAYTCSDVTTVTYGGQEWARFDATTDQGYDQTMIMRKENGYMVCVTLTYFPDHAEEAETYLNSFIEVQ